MTKPQYSNFTLNANKGAARDPKLPTMRGEATILDVDGTPVPFEHAVWGPNAPTEDGKREYYSLRITPKDPALAARQAQMANGRIETPDVPNARDDYNAGTIAPKIGQGVLFERSRDELEKAASDGKKPTSFFGSVVVLLPSGPRAIDIATWFRAEHGFHSGSANHHDPVKAKVARDAKAQAGAHGGPVRPDAGRRGGAASAPEVR